MTTIIRRSTLTGKIHTMEIPVDPDQMLEWIHRTAFGGRTVQEIFPDLTPEQREFIKTGITPEEWDAATKEEQE